MTKSLIVAALLSSIAAASFAQASAPAADGAPAKKVHKHHGKKAAKAEAPAASK